MPGDRISETGRDLPRFGTHTHTHIEIEWMDKRSGHIADPHLPAKSIPQPSQYSVKGNSNFPIKTIPNLKEFYKILNIIY